MKVLGIRWCQVSEDAEALAGFLGSSGLGIAPRDLGMPDDGTFHGAVLPAGEGSWMEFWPSSEGMGEMTMLQIVVDDADAFAANARANGLDPKGPTDAHGERIYMLTAPNGQQISFQSKVESA